MRVPALHWQTAIALAFAVAAGALVGPAAAFIEACAFVGTLFLNALTLLIVPLVFSAMVNGLGSIGESRTVGRLGAITLAFYLGSGVLAILTGLVAVNLIQPGFVDGEPAGALLGLTASADEVMANVEGKGTDDLLGVITRLVPKNVIAAAAAGDLLGLVLFGFLFGWFVSRLPEHLHHTQREFWQGIYQVVLGIANAVMRLAPIGVFALVAPAIAKTGWDVATPLLKFFAAVIGALLFHALITLPLILRLVARVSPLYHLRTMMPALLTAFSTSSSNATLPVTLDRLENTAKVPRRVTGFVLPIGANVNTDGTALYECAAAMFIAQAYGLPLDFATQFTIVLVALLTSVGVAGIPSASLVAIAVILTSIGLPLEGLGLILAVDRLLDMCRTTVNVLGDSVATVVAARLNREDGVYGHPALRASGQRAKVD